MSKRAWFIGAILVLLALRPTSILSSARETPDKNGSRDDRGVIAHEWGTFTSVAGRDGAAVEWRPLEARSDLPSFVYTAEGLADAKGLRNPRRCLKCSLAALVRMETPVIYFYSEQEATLSVRVEFPQGKITEWYPQARSVRDTAIDWGLVTTQPAADVEFPTEPNQSHYYPARETDAAPLRVCGNKSVEHEKFLFYRGVGFFLGPIRGRLEGDYIAIDSAGAAPVDTVLVFENQNGMAGFSITSTSDATTVLRRPALTSPSETVAEEVATQLRSLLVSKGLFEREADAMLATWRDSWFEEGLRVFYVVPREITDSLLPLRIEPRPSKIERVLVGRLEMITPEMESTVIHAVAAQNSAMLSAALQARYGRLLEPLLRRAVETATDPQVESKLRKLLYR